MKQFQFYIDGDNLTGKIDRPLLESIASKYFTRGYTLV
jgi:hypothetical protein